MTHPWLSDKIPDTPPDDLFFMSEEAKKLWPRALAVLGARGLIHSNVRILGFAFFCETWVRYKAAKATGDYLEADDLQAREMLADCSLTPDEFEQLLQRTS